MHLIISEKIDSCRDKLAVVGSGSKLLRIRTGWSVNSVTINLPNRLQELLPVPHERTRISQQRDGLGALRRKNFFAAFGAAVPSTQPSLLISKRGNRMVDPDRNSQGDKEKARRKLRSSPSDKPLFGGEKNADAANGK